jgi:hypothetical protein
MIRARPNQLAKTVAEDGGQKLSGVEGKIKIKKL